MHKELIEYKRKLSEKPNALPKLNIKNHSKFYNDIRRLVVQTQKLLESKRPLINGDLWQERKYQLEILELSLTRANCGPVPDDTPLFVDCHFVEKNCNSSWVPFSRYNEFKGRLEGIIRLVKPNEMNRSTYANILLMQQQLEEERNRVTEHTASEVKLKYARQLQENACLGAIDEALGDQDQVLSNLIRILQQHISTELKSVEALYAERFDQIEENNKQMQESLLKLVADLSTANRINDEFKEQYPSDYQRARVKVKQSMDKEMTRNIGSSKSSNVSKLLGHHGSPIVNSKPKQISEEKSAQGRERVYTL